ncbi:thiolase [Mycobacterium sp. E1715]|uniref:acetyl-CoA acetyltransferase n=1 Tax=unclassified Mycobacterium TaxID=2642494 RepID=UPI000801CBDE|nr:MULTISPECIES: acetyl-CoA acetyltransferase [unclassified Mycobacterium]OBG65912.1 thiolase [Mycobacterium sp. E188]OBG83328.1 thiolase [Mycobacterium sp. E3305]OBH17797.1 thiolase [Mycobacterium sp. E1715]OBH38318.1 thiolase [Mycobacterium sp. E183]
MTTRGVAAIAGVADEVSASGVIDVPLRELEARVITAALADAGLSLRDVDGLCTCTGGTLMHSVELAEYLGIAPRFTDATQTGGASYGLYVEHAAAAIAAGEAETVVIVYASTPRAARKRGEKGLGVFATPERLEWETPFGVMLPISAYALAANRHMAVYGTTPEQLAQIAVDTRRWAALNERAHLREAISVQDVLDSGFLAEPLHKLECCLVTDGAAAVVVTSAERARDLAKPPAFVLGAATAASHAMISQMPDLTVTPGALSGPAAFRAAGLRAADIDVVELYDSFTITVLLALEDLGFCGKGEGGPFVADGALGPGGTLPAQTSGGGLAYTHPGAFGAFLLVEAARQLRGECGERQVPDAKTAVAHGTGGVLSATSTVILGTEATL